MRRASVVLGFVVAASLIPIYLLSFNGLYRVDDEHLLGARAQSLALWGRLDAPQVSGNSRFQALAVMGDQATQIEPAQSVLGAGLYRLGLALGVGGQQTMLTLGVYVTALCALVIFFTIRSGGFGDPVAVLVTLLFGLGTMAWPYASTFFRDSLAMLMVAVAWLGWVRLHRPGEGSQAWNLAWIALGLVGGMLAKSTAAAIVPAFGVTWFLEGAARLRSRRVVIPRGAYAVLAAMALVVGVVVLLPARGVWARYTLDYYGFLAGHFAGSLSPATLVETLGPFVSPAKSIFLFSPPLLLAVAGFASHRRWPWTIWVPVIGIALGLSLGQALFYRQEWAGYFGWGLKFMLPALPGLILLSAPAVEASFRAAHRIGRAILWAFLGLGMVIQLAGSWVPWRAAYNAWQAAGLDPYTLEAAWSPRFLLIPGQVVRLFSPRMWNLAWSRLMPVSPADAGIFVAFGLALAAAGGWLVLRLLNRAVVSRKTAAVACLFVALATISPVAPAQWLVKNDPALGRTQPAFRMWSAWADAHVGSQDTVVVDSYASPLWAYMSNAWRMDVAWYSLPFRGPGVPPPSVLDAAAQLVLSEAHRTGHVVWLVGAGSPADMRQAPAWLAALPNADLAATFQGPQTVEVWRITSVTRR